MDSDDSLNPYLPSSSYMNLLHSQLDNQNLEYTPLDSPCSETPSEPASPQENRKSRNAWLPTDDIMLVSAWLNTSKDPITSNQQRLASFWGRIAKYFASCPNADGRPKREASHCTGVKRGRVSIDGSEQDAHHPIDVDEPLPRPTGVKAAKGRSKKSSNTQPIDVEEDGKANLEVQLERVSRMYEMKQKDFELKEKEFAMKKENIKYVMLENLISKKDTLTESEKALKEKLIDDMMSSG
ncbi:PREDICTED: uncharacterized protein LOC104719976 [Camelina sativa]|uniref:Uncharacterized protein LOC104719976 n=1 Tax=Camelina sativa TaxID=90675 RepID=A0ABM0U5R9_CAMSA|nr:PREDICTED: uncharacterized protein LOC104719976 [Camelina sativa]